MHIVDRFLHFSLCLISLLNCPVIKAVCASFLWFHSLVYISEQILSVNAAENEEALACCKYLVHIQGRTTAQKNCIRWQKKGEALR